LVFYIMIFSRSFGAIGTARKQIEGDVPQEWFLWCLGSTLFGTVVAHFGINYMAQLIMGFFPLVACISVATFEARQVALQGVASPLRGAYIIDEVNQNARHEDPSSRGRGRVPSWLKA
jgi:hypothetical protein